jgi:hypothetical protein
MTDSQTPASQQAPEPIRMPRPVSAPLSAPVLNLPPVGTEQEAESAPFLPLELSSQGMLPPGPAAPRKEDAKWRLFRK